MMSGLREAVRIIDILTTGNDYTAEAEVMESMQRQSASEKDEVWDITRKLDAIELSDVLYKNRESLLQDLFFNVKTTKGRLHLAKELLTLPAESLKSFAGTKEGLTTLNSWILVICMNIIYFLIIILNHLMLVHGIWPWVLTRCMFLDKFMKVYVL